MTRNVVPLQAVAKCLLLILVGVFVATGSYGREKIVSEPVRSLIELLRNDAREMKAVKQAILAQAAREGSATDGSDVTDEALLRLIETDPSVALLARETVAKARANTSVAQTDSETSTTAETTDAAAALTYVKAGENSTLERQAAAALKQRDEETQQPAEAQTVPTSKIDGEAHKRETQPPTAKQSPTSSGPRHPYAHVPLLDELYAQVPAQRAIPERFGATVLRNGGSGAQDLPMDLPVGAEYVVGPGDGLKIELWGGVSQRLQRVVDREGRIALPEVGVVEVAGKNLGDVQQLVLSTLKTQFREIQAAVSLIRLRSVRVFVVGDVERPGAYDISSLSTPLNAIISAGGPTERGSARIVRHYRGKQLVQELDLYELMLRGVRGNVQRIESGDTVLVPPSMREITIEGMVRRPAVYEVRDERDLAGVLEMAGGVLPAGTMQHIDIERIVPHEGRSVVSFDVVQGIEAGELAQKLREFAIQDGDKLRIRPISPYSEKSVYLDGHVFNPGKRAWTSEMKVRDVLRSYAELLPEPYMLHAEVLRLTAPEYRPQVIAFNLKEALEGNASGMELQPFDTVRVFGRYEFEDAPEITIRGEVRDPGVHRMSGETKLSSAIYMAGGLTPDALEDVVHIFRESEGSKVRVISADLRKALAGDATEDVVILPRDQVVVHRNPARVDPAVVYIGGRVVAPGKYPLGEGMTASELVRLAGGFRRGAYTISADLTRVQVEADQRGLKSQVSEVRIGEAVSGNKNEDVPLKDGDVLSIRQIAGWGEIGASIVIRGEVAHPGTYGIVPGERLSSVLKRAGGFQSDAYAQGAVLRRVEVKELAQKAKDDLIERLQESASEAPQVAGGTSAQEREAMLQSVQSQQKQMIATLKRQEVDGRLVVNLSGEIEKWKNSPNDIEVRDGDELVIPKRPDFILVSGQVYNRTAITWVPNKTAEWYLKRAGGPTDGANKKAIFVVRANGAVVGRGSDGGWGNGVLGLKLQPGDSVVVPEKIVTTNSTWKSLMNTAQLMSAVALTAAAVAGL